MIAMKILDIKAFMKLLLLSDTFEHFLVAEASITTFNTFHIDGTLKKDFFTSEELEENGLSDRNYSCWAELRPFCLSLIKGQKTPLHFKMVFVLSAPNTVKLLKGQGLPFSPEDIEGMFLNITYRDNALTCTTGTSMRLFTLDRSLEHSWDGMVQKFFKTKGISFETNL